MLGRSVEAVQTRNFTGSGLGCYNLEVNSFTDTHMKNLLLLLACFLLFVSFAYAQKSSMEYLQDGSALYMNRDYKGAIKPYQKALDLEKKERKLERQWWIALVDNLGMAYGMTGDIKSSFAVFEYGVSVEPTYPLFYYNMACGYGELGDEENAIKWLRPAYKYKANMIAGERFPNAETDSSFAKFRDSEKFKQALAEMKSEK
ncbi:MAG: hypothetical protein ABI481_00545 [Pyrinomonadaceae bacterium]